jgi:8-oxo-dGTP pyrophosphatase MutT (NUDIX family)
MTTEIYDNAISGWYNRAVSLGRNIRKVRQIGDFMEIVETFNPDNNAKRLLQLVHDSVIIIPVINYRGKIFTVLGEEFRDGASETLVGFPAGRLKPGSNIIEEAERELLEETPIKKEWITSLEQIDTGRRNYSTPGATNEQIHFVMANIQLPEGITPESLHGVHQGLEEEQESIDSIVEELNLDLLKLLGTESSKLGLLLALNNLN